MTKKNNIVQVKVIPKYGTPFIYPANENAEIFCKLLGKKTLDKRNLGIIQELGFKVEELANMALGDL